MAWITFSAEGRSRYGILHDGGVFDLHARIGSVLPDLKSLLTARALGMDLCPAPHIRDYAIDEVVFLPVIPNPAKVLCVGLNYQEHRRETGRAETKHPSIFTRFPDTLIGHRDSIRLPPNSTALDYEGELAVVIGRPAFRLDASEALEVVGGYTVFNDATIRDWQHHTHQFTPGKNFPATGALGPALIDPLEAGPLEEKAIETQLNGVTVQSARLGDMIFTVAQIVAYVSGFTPLSVGDVIATGTPGGVGFKRDPPSFMKDGDSVTVTIEGIGTLVNSIAPEIAPVAAAQ